MGAAMIDWNCFIATMRERFPALWIIALVLLLSAAAFAFVGCMGFLAAGPLAFFLCFIPVFLACALLGFLFFSEVLVSEAAVALQACIVTAAAGAAGAVLPGAAPGAATPSDCATAQAELANAQAALAAAETALRAQEQRVVEARTRLRNAKNAAVAALAVVAALLVNPFGWGALAAAIAAQVAALALVVQRSSQLGQELGKLSQRAIDHAAAQARLAAAEAFVRALCGSLPPGQGSLTEGTLPPSTIDVRIAAG